ncbi:hypothetical protein [Hymenobacter wooponensis]|uniref:Lipoprotein n=1 Tax=Hymenobacter wooponensis TaxID=1525360 RepID=A0A4Z0MLB6_9BACT|nr:hypothetical protein [Hymenobacter wooponensis]TGD80219.1 hypothetical protein EU557_10245 [Hymenobacter wooponensis]
MKRILLSLIFGSALGLSSCAIGLLEPVTLPEFEQSATPLPVKGLQSLVIGQRISFGEFQLGKVHRGWTSTRYYSGGGLRPGPSGLPVLDVLNLPAAQYLRNSSNKLQFSLEAGPRHSEIYCVNNVSSRELAVFTPIVRGPINITQDWKNTFTGLIVGPELDSVNVWNIVLTTSLADADSRNNPEPVVGLVGSNDEVLLRIQQVVRRSVKHPKTHQQVALPVPMPIGYQIMFRDQAIGFVDLQTPEGTVWLRTNMPPNMRFLAANTAATVMLWSRGIAL